jgi:pimeloyl-ACP methyl ester carboxylesterase
MAYGIFPLTCAYDLHNGIAGSKLVLLPRVGHMPQVQASLSVARIILREASRHETR